MCPTSQLLQARALEDPAQKSVALFSMYDHLRHAATKAGVSYEDLRQQLWEEYVPKHNEILHLTITQPGSTLILFSVRHQLHAPPVRLPSLQEM